MWKRVLPWAASAWRVSAKWVALMAGLFAIARELAGLNASVAGQPIEPSLSLAIFGHLSVIAFIIAGFSEWLFLRRRIKELESGPAWRKAFVEKLANLMDEGRALADEFRKVETANRPTDDDINAWLKSIQAELLLVPSSDIYIARFNASDETDGTVLLGVTLEVSAKYNYVRSRVKTLEHFIKELMHP
jgi:hypothetical protein